MGARQDKPDQRSFGERWLPHPLLTVVLVLLWMLLLNSFSFGGLLVGVVLALVITRLTSNFWPERPPVKSWSKAFAYLGVKLLINPLVWISGLAYLYYNELGAAGFNVSLGLIATLHTIGAFMMLCFLIAHVYLITTGHTVGAHLKAMITGWEEAEEASGKTH